MKVGAGVGFIEGSSKVEIELGEPKVGVTPAFAVPNIPTDDAGLLAGCDAPNIFGWVELWIEFENNAG